MTRYEQIDIFLKLAIVIVLAVVGMRRLEISGYVDVNATGKIPIDIEHGVPIKGVVEIAPRGSFPVAIQNHSIPVDVRAATTNNAVRGRPAHHPAPRTIPTRKTRMVPSVHDEATDARLYPARYAPRPAIVRCW